MSDNIPSYRHIIDIYMAQSDGKQKISQQIESFNQFIETDIPEIIHMSNPITVRGSPEIPLAGPRSALATATGLSTTAANALMGNSQDGTYASGKIIQHEYEITLEFEKISIRKPTIFENNGAIHPMMPNDARLRNLTYAAPLNIDVKVTTTFIDHTRNGIRESNVRIFPNVHLGKVPVMVGSKYCLLHDQKHVHPSKLGECAEDVGGYFIIQGGERAMISMERMSENRPFVFRNGRGSAKEMEVVEIKCIGPDNDQVPKSNTVKIVYHPKNQLITMLRATVPRIKTDIPLIILFRALGVLADKDIYELILGKEDDSTYDPIITESILEASSITTQEQALLWLSEHTNTWSVKTQKQSNVQDILSEELFPHIGSQDMNYEKACFLAHMTRKVLWTSSKRIPTDDRDAYPNKRVDIPGFLLADLFRKTYNNRMIKDMKASLSKEIHGGSWKATGNWSEIVNINNINKIIKSTIMDVSLKSSLATGNFGNGKIGSQSKIGVSQVLNRLNYTSALSHLRRISTPIEKTGKLIAPRKQHNTQWGYICPCETPEGHGVGVIKNMASTASITIFSSPITVYSFIQNMNKLISLPNSTIEQLHNHTRVFLNGSWIGILLNDDTEYVVNSLRKAKRSGQLHIYTGIIWKISYKELWLSTEAGRIIRPVYYAPTIREIASDKTCTLKKQILSITDWNQLLLWESPSHKHLIEYLDAGETEGTYIAMDYDSCIKDKSYTHCEIHPSVIFGTAASGIPFPDHNQSPRNAYQCLWEYEHVLMANGTKQFIKDVKVGDKVVTFDPENGQLSLSNVIYNYTRKTDKKIYKIKTISGREIIATEDHLFITENGWKEVREIINSPIKRLGIIPNWLFPDSSIPNKYITISKENMIQQLTHYNIKNSLIHKHITILESLQLMPLYSDDTRLSTLARIFGFVITDGSINVYNKKGYMMCQVGCNFGTKKDAIDFENDVMSLGFNRSSIHLHQTKINGYDMTTYAVSHNGPFASFIASLGITIGKSTNVIRKPIPNWIMFGSDNVKREFLAGFQGGDGCKIRYNRNKHNQNFVCAETTNQINQLYRDSLYVFMTQISELFTYFNIKNKIVERLHKNTNSIIGIKLSDNSSNLIKYYDTIGYRYATTKTISSFKTIEYLKYKSILSNDYVNRISSIRNDISTGIDKKVICSTHNITMAKLSDISRGMKMSRQITMRKLEDNEYSDIVCQLITNKDNIMFVPIESIVLHENVTISDITVDNEHHSFITTNNIGSHNCAMGKQAMGMYSLNYRERFDAMSHVLCYPEKPMVSPYMSKYYGAQTLPAGQNIIVAIMTYTGYNQEDSNMINRAALDRDRFRSIFFRTYKDEERKNQSSGEEEKFCHPDPSETKHMKNAHYEKIGDDGFVPKDTFVTPDDILIGKVVPLRVPTGTVLPAGAKKSRDVSKMPRNNESGYVDKIYKNRNGEGYSFAKIRMRQDRIPEIGDKFSSRHGQKGTMGMILNPEDMPQTASGIVPDIIINPHCLADDHEILTEHGFMNWKEVKELYENKSIKLAGYNHITKELVYEFPTNFILNESKEQEMIEFTHIGEKSDNNNSNGVSLLVTSDHDMFAKKGKNYGHSISWDGIQKGSRGSSIKIVKDYEKCKANTLLSDDNMVVKFIGKASSGVTNLNHKLPFEEELLLNSYNKYIAFCELYGYWLGDGCLRFGGNSVEMCPVKLNDDTWLRERFNTLELIINADYTYNIIGGNNNNPIRYRWSIINKKWFNLFCSEYGKKYKKYNKSSSVPEITSVTEPESVKSAKWMAPWVWNLPCDLAKAVLSGLRYADGCEKANRNTIWTSSTRFRDEIMRLALHAGFSSHFTIQHEANQQCGTDKNNNPIISRYISWKVTYTESSRASEPVLYSNRDIKKTNYNGLTWCVTMPHGFIITRRAKRDEKGIVIEASRPIITGQCIPSRMTIAQLMETLLSKIGCMSGCLGDGSPFNETTVEDLSTILRDNYGMEPYGNEIMYNGYTGRMMETSIFIGPCYYQRLRHCSADKMHSRASGPLVMLTRQPAEGRAREGGLRFGEMERDCVVAHGMAEFTKERLMECSDQFSCYSCNDCGLLAVANPNQNIWNCRGCGNTTSFSHINIPYATKLLLQELETMCIGSRLITNQKLICNSSK